MSNKDIVKEIALWALTHHMDAVGDHLDLSDHELAKALPADGSIRGAISDQTTGEYWDCECKDDYIHKKTERTTCTRCGTEEQDQPDSRVDEVIAAIVKGRGKVMRLFEIQEWWVCRFPDFDVVEMWTCRSEVEAVNSEAAVEKFKKMAKHEDGRPAEDSACIGGQPFNEIASGDGSCADDALLDEDGEFQWGSNSTKSVPRDAEEVWTLFSQWEPLEIPNDL